MILLIKAVLIIGGILFAALVMIGASYDYGDYREADRNAGYTLPDYSYIKGMVRSLARILRIKVKEY